MDEIAQAAFLAVDVGNSSVRVGLFRLSQSSAGLPVPCATHRFDVDQSPDAALGEWLDAYAREISTCYLASVNASASGPFAAWLGSLSPAPGIEYVAHGKLPLKIDVECPERVGIDRLLAAVAVNSVRTRTQPAIIVDAGTAITVDCVSPEGAFIGGAILPGMRLWARSLDRYTEKLPLIDTAALCRPAVLGRNTEAAMRSGIYWGVCGAVEGLMRHMKDELGQNAEIYLTGGDAYRLSLPEAVSIEHLVLSGIAVTADHLSRAGSDGAEAAK